MSRRRILIEQWATTILAYVLIFPFIMVWDFVSSPFRLWAVAREMIRERLAAAEMRQVVILAIERAAKSGELLEIPDPKGGKGLVN